MEGAFPSRQYSTTNPGPGAGLGGVFLCLFVCLLACLFNLDVT